jgi:hypothetical protein
MKKLVLKQIAIASTLLLALGSAQAHEVNYNVVTTWLEPMTQPNNSIFEGSFTYNEHTHAVSGLRGRLSESMTSLDANNTMAWVDLSHQLASWYDASLGGTFAAVFKNATTATFWGGGWTPQEGINVGSVYAGFPVKAQNAGNAYALIFVPDAPTAALTQAQLDQLAYADCVPTAPGGMSQGGGMMGSVCMTGLSAAVYGQAGTMNGTPLSQTIAAAVPEPSSYALLLAGLGCVAGVARRRGRQA